MPLAIRSTRFDPNGEIPTECTCEGSDVSPHLAWSGVPAAARSLALVVYDPDAPDPRAPQRTWVHWVLYDIPPHAGGLPDGVRTGSLPSGTHEGKNDWNRTGFGGPCPPIGRHRYFFKLYALDVALGDRHALTRAELEQAMAGHVLAEAELVGTYQKKKQ
jgi:Raf kinase inhibitor-like YbhB/YbcL family protein